jgi:hypothetical protein
MSWYWVLCSMVGLYVAGGLLCLLVCWRMPNEWRRDFFGPSDQATGMTDMAIAWPVAVLGVLEFGLRWVCVCAREAIEAVVSKALRGR